LPEPPPATIPAEIRTQETTISAFCSFHVARAIMLDIDEPLNGHAIAAEDGMRPTKTSKDSLAAATIWSAVVPTA
jgi:hypothetical protein